MKAILLLPFVSLLLVSCDARVNTAGPPVKEEKKMEKNTTIVNTPAPETKDTKTTTTTTETKK